MAIMENERWDAIVIGSGIGGLGAAAALSRVGHKVLLLEQHYKLGGLTHTFSRDGFTWDVGIHYLSDMAPGDSMRVLLDWLADTPIEFAAQGAVYDYLYLGTAKPLALSRPFEAQERDLKDRFPEEREAIEAWTDALQAGRKALLDIFPTRAMPAIAGRLLDWWNSRELERWCARTTRQVIAEITDNPELAAALSAQWGDHGGRPGTASFAMHAMIAGAFLRSGSWYPIGGADAFAQHMAPTITKSGGSTRTGVQVESLLWEGKRVVGVKTADGQSLYSKVVVPNIGARETVTRLLSTENEHQDWITEIKELPHGIANFTLFLGFEGDIEAAGATKANHWFYPTGETDVLWLSAPDGPLPCMTVMFGSIKDPAHNPGPRQKHTAQILVWTDWSTVEQWANTTAGARGDDYEDFKRRVEQTLMAQFEIYFPELAKLVVYRNLATPLSTVSFTGHQRGEFYGLDVTPERVLCGALRAKTPIPGLYLSGQDVACPGIPGALWGGLLAAASIDPRVLSKIKR